MREFQHVAAHELPVVCDDFDLSPEARKALDGYVHELENWLAGILTWHRGCLRYTEAELRHPMGSPGRLAAPTGLGMSAARLFRASVAGVG